MSEETPPGRRSKRGDPPRGTNPERATKSTIAGSGWSIALASLSIPAHPPPWRQSGGNLAIRYPRQTDFVRRPPAGPRRIRSASARGVELIRFKAPSAKLRRPPHLPALAGDHA